MKVKSESEVAQSCLTLSDHMDWSLPGSSVHGIFQVRVLEWGAIMVVIIKIYFKIGDTPREGVEGERWTGNLGLVQLVV